MRTEQMDFWSGKFGKEYTVRNTKEHEDWNQQYLDNYGLTRLQMNGEFLGNLRKDLRILEIGCNTGQQLEGLHKQGFRSLHGIELQWHAVEYSKVRADGIAVLQASGFEIPFKSGAFDLVFTSGVLIHIAPRDLPAIIGEIYRCSSRYIWGFEYYSDKNTEINYRGNTGVLWKADFASIFVNLFPALTIVRKRLYPYVNDTEYGNVDCMYLLEKKA
ncbi:MAG: Methyltransferase domain protein [Syntrophorhabdus sp. PtaU1.Bin050]|nr:MAG: Methyltransferase domain protein [Syntrophorhabdus sp. PtaU1.Bin050]